MENRIDRKVPELLTKAALVKAGAETYGPQIPLMQNTPENIGADRDALLVANNNVEQAKVYLAEKRSILKSLEQTCYAFAVFGRDILKPIHGTSYSDAYNELGLYGSLQVPRTAKFLLIVVETYGSYFVAHPDREDEAHNITAARAKSLFNDLSQAYADVAAARTALDQARDVRNEAAGRMYRRIRGVFNEMKQFISDVDPRWTAFGFNKPGAENIPDVPEEIEVVASEPTATAIRWPASPRAQHYRIYKQVIGVDEEPVPIASSSEPGIVFDDLPANSKIKVGIAAANSGGESKLSELLEINTT